MGEHPDCALIRRGYDAFISGDMDTLAGLMTTDVTHHVPGESSISGHHKGREACVQLYRRQYDVTGGTLRVELETLAADGRGHVISVHRCRAEREDRGLDMKEGMFFTIVGGKISDIDECHEDIDASNAFWR
ncbi:nuclear transport factor 2 family protein [Streptomyces sp. NBS 14/10]|uniref:nuclear transport factor 2 family protein n=1 Tax=Streptomyces sp. NBS 14/10 TaxID=1945643 RepID=UPI000B7C9BDB|nr:nuclear transport factor 2 family protein [Streptomyces sp. NBS 14/10]KAK1180467.1 nuclear transport factor 2 family protein [Streptomyces sp. NBS 14/10]NUP40572.1 nuclear transport factor 2 family protein [Streptomyces sp.]NUS86160.1 nuclear transport factor 2 family protein [Streptomyces sp.]